VWAEKAPLLGVVFARRRFERNGKPNRWGVFDSGAAAFALNLEAHRRGLATHFMGGFDEAAAYDALGVPKDDYEAMAAFAVGHRGDPATLPENLRERETPSGRKDLARVAVEGRFES
jgi:nitroreductase